MTRLLSAELRKMWHSCFFLLAFSVDVYKRQAFSLKKNYYSNCPTKTTKEEHNEKQ